MKKALLILLTFALLIPFGVLPVTAEEDPDCPPVGGFRCWGDPDGDGDVTSTDARLALQYSVGKIQRKDLSYPAAADVDGDDSLTSTDARLILQHSVGKINRFPVEEIPDGFKVGIILCNDESSFYDGNILQAVDGVKKLMGLRDEQVIVKMHVPEGEECYTAALELADEGCGAIFADAFGHEPFMIRAAKERPQVQFCQTTGIHAHTAGLSNYHNAFAAIYQGRYLTGVAAGMKLNAMIEAGEFTAEEARLGYVGAFTYAEVVSSYTAFFLGARSVCPSVTMDVTFVGAWYDEKEEERAAAELIEGGCKLISQHSDSPGAPRACEAAGVPNVAYGLSYAEECPNTHLVSCRIDWIPYFTYMISSVSRGAAMWPDYVGDLASDSVHLTDLTGAAAPGTGEILAQTEALLINGDLQVFDVSAFTVEGEHPVSALADVDDDGTFTPETEAIHDGYYHESEYRSAPYFDLMIDGITLLNMRF